MSDLTYNQHDVVWLEGNSQGTPLATSTTAAQTAALPRGTYHIWAGVDTYIKVDETANDVTSASGYLLRANQTMRIDLASNRKLGAILASGTGTLSYHRVSK